MKAIYNNTTNSLIAFKGDHRPIQICKGGQLIDNISAVPLITEQDIYTSEYKANLIGLELQGNTVVVNDYTNQVMTMITTESWSSSGVTGVAIISLPSEMIDKNITYYLSASLPSGYSIGLLKGSNFLFGESVAITTQPIVASGYDNIYINGITSYDEIPNIFENVTLYAQEKADASNIDVELKVPIIPSEYQQVEYIQSTGTQYIDTGIIPRVTATKQTGIEVTYQYTNLTSSFVFGSRTGSGATNNYYHNRSSTGRFGIYIGNNGRGIAEDDTNKHTMKVKSNRTIEFDGQQIEFDYGAFTGIYSIYLFACNQQESSPYLPSQIKLYSCTMTDINGNLVRDYIPCYRKADGVIGLYDIVNNEFKINQGTGNFRKGTNVTPTFMIVNIPYTLATGDKLTLKDKKVMLNNTDITSSEVGQNLLALAEATQNQTNIITATSEIPLSKKIITYAKWGGDSEN